MNIASKIAKESIITFSGMIYGNINRYIYSALLARWVGPEYLGIYSIANAIMLISEVVAKMGLETGVMRYVSRLKPDSDIKKIRKIIASALKMSFLFSILIMFFLIASTPFIVKNILKEKPLLISVLMVFSIAIPFNSLTQVSAFATQGFKKLKYKSLVTQFLNPSVLLIAMIVSYLYFSKEAMLISPMLFSGIIGTFAMLYLLAIVSGVKPIQVIKAPFDFDLLKFSYPFMFVIILQTFMHWMDILMLGFYTDASTVGLYHPAARTAGLLQALLLSFLSIYGPMAAQFHSENNIPKMEEIYKLVSRWILIFSIPITLLFVIFPKEILFLFGQDYTASSNVLMILSVATFIQAFLGAAGPTLGMAGFNRLVLWNTIGAFTLNLLLNIFLIPIYGVIGAATATLISLSAIGVARVLEVKILININFINIKIMKPIYSGILTLVAMIFLKKFLYNYHILVVLTFAIAVSFITYSLSLWFFGLEKEDKDFIAAAGIIKKGFKKRS